MYKETGLTPCVALRFILDVIGLASSAAMIQQGAFKLSNPAIKVPTNRDGLRMNMLKQGDPPSETAQAHHDLPWKFRGWFADQGRGLNVNDPQYGRWVEPSPHGSHQSWSNAFNDAWETFIVGNSNASKSHVLQFLTQLLNSGKFPSK